MKNRKKETPNWQKGANTDSNSFDFSISFANDQSNHFSQEIAEVDFHQSNILSQKQKREGYKKMLLRLCDQNTAMKNATYGWD